MREKHTPLAVVGFIIIFAALILLLAACSPKFNLGDGENGNSGGGGNGENGGDGTTNTEGNTSPVDTPITEDDVPNTGPIPIRLVFVPGSRFQMGSMPEDPIADEDEIPQHTVSLPGFFIFESEVTNRIYQQCVEAGECDDPVLQEEDGPTSFYRDPEYAEHPIVGVSWFQAEAFCAYTESRLPTEAEWEKTSRGEDGATYPWGDEIPSCDQSNYESCLSDPDTVRGDEYDPEGLSPYEAMQMAGNAGEWTFDWYDEDYYDGSPASNPQGPALGKLKVVRGGGYLSGFEALRSAARLGFDPREGYEDVGFRCVPVGETPSATGFAPFCEQAYVPFCTPGGRPGTGITVIPGDDPNLTVVGLGCVERGRMDVNIDLGLPSANGYDVTVNGVEYTDCVEYPEYPGRLYCNGPAPAEGATVTVEVCNNGNISYTDPNVAKLVSVNSFWSGPVAKPSLQTYGDVDDNCPQGYYYDTGRGMCIQTDDGSNRCPDGWSLNALSYRCEPDDEGSCPDGSYFDEQTESCIPEGDDCGPGYYMAALPGVDQRSCEPETNGGGNRCAEGYFFDSAINCCAPIPTTNYGCEDGFYYDAAYDRCVPITEAGCPIGYEYDRYQGCVPGEVYTHYPGTTAPSGGPGSDTGCPPGSEYDIVQDACVPNREPATPRFTCAPGEYKTDYGRCVPNYNEVGDCAENAYYDALFERCIATDDECGLGYYFNELTESCVPTDGPGSGCAPGFAYSTRVDCCVPTPGNPGGLCPGDEEAGPSTLNGPYATAGYPAQTPTSFDYDRGLCDPGGEDCPPGYYFDTDLQTCMPTGNDCPRGTTFDRYTETCRPDDGNGCPDGYFYDTSRDACIPTDNGQDGCADGYYFDTGLGFCVQQDEDGCGLGYYATELGCEPIPQNNSEENCPLGYYFDTASESCVPVTPGTGECYTVTVTIPICAPSTPTPDLRCPAGKHWNEKDQVCVDRTSTEPDVPACSSYGNPNACGLAGCDWEIIGGTTAPLYGCVDP